MSLSRKERRGAASRRFFFGPNEIAGYYTHLRRGFQEIGVSADQHIFGDHPFQYETGPVPAVDRLIRRAGARLSKRSSMPPFIVAGWMMIHTTLRLAFFLRALFRYDVFVFGFGTSLLPRNLDVPILTAFGKCVIVNLGHGSDLRPPYINGAFKLSAVSDDAVAQAMCAATDKMNRVVSRLERHADLIVGAPFSTTQFASRPMINWFALGVPLCFPNISEVETTKEDPGPVRVLHSPSNPRVKGSERIRACVTRLKEQGCLIDYVEITNRPNSEVLAEIAACDFVIDQLYSDTPMAAFATEAAWFGKPAVVGGYGLEHLKGFVPDTMFPPSEICVPSDLEASIKRLVTDVSYRKALGERARSFVRNQWSAGAVAKRYLRLVSGDIPDDWWLNPGDVTYLMGCGLSEDRLRQNVRRVVTHCGVEGLGLRGRPDLERLFLSMAEDRAR